MRYPEFTGDEPCTEVGTDLYYHNEGVGGSYTDLPLLRTMCLRDCHNVDACREWSVRHEYYGFWAGMTEQERRDERRRRNIVLQEPHIDLIVRAVPRAS